MASILIVDDLSSIHEMLEAVIRPTGYDIKFAEEGEKALSLYKSENFEVVLADISMQPMDGITLLGKLKEYDPGCVVIMMTGYASTDTAIKALKYGAFDYIKKPFKIDELLQTLARAVEYQQLEKQKGGASAAVMTKPEEESGDLEKIIPGNSDKTVRLRRHIAKLVNSQTPVFLQGEKGVGKRSIAEILHRGRSDENAAFVGVDCSLGIEESFRVSLLGEDHRGGEWINGAVGGTLFLENVDLLDRDLQEKFVGVLKSNISRFRMVCSSTVDLEGKVDAEEFNDELFYRIATLPLFLHPLRERLEDIPDILESVVARAVNPRFDTRQIEFSDEAMEALKCYGWPGNLAEFRQTVSTAVSRAETRIVGLEDLPERVRPLEGWPTLEEYLAPFETRYVRAVLTACGNDENRAAEVLGCEVSRVSELVQ